MTKNSTKPAANSIEDGHFLWHDWFDPLENCGRTPIRGFIEELLESELSRNRLVDQRMANRFRGCLDSRVKSMTGKQSLWATSEQQAELTCLAGSLKTTVARGPAPVKCKATLRVAARPMQLDDSATAP